MSCVGVKGLSKLVSEGVCDLLWMLEDVMLECDRCDVECVMCYVLCLRALHFAKKKSSLCSLLVHITNHNI